LIRIGCGVALLSKAVAKKTTMELKSGKNRMVEAEEREWVCWILLVRLMFVLFLGLLLMWY